MYSTGNVRDGRDGGGEAEAEADAEADADTDTDAILGSSMATSKCKGRRTHLHTEGTYGLLPQWLPPFH